MYRVTLPRIGTAEAWRDAARAAATNDIPAADIDWQFDTQTSSLFDAAPLPEARGTLGIPKDGLKLLTAVCWHADPERFALAYANLLRLAKDPRLIHDKGDAGMARLTRMQKNVGRCIHKMHAFVRFRELPSDGPRPRFAAWFEPTHHTVEPATPFFAKRFGDMDWLIATPDVTARFEGGRLSYHPGAPRPDLPEDATEALWTEYYRSIFNPARVKVQAMRSEMPVKYWKNMPETRIIPELLSGAEARVREMQAAAPTRAPAFAARVKARQVPTGDVTTLAALQEKMAAIGAEEGLGRMIPGEGPPDARLVILGERPGDLEDRLGRPFVGPAGQLLDAAAGEAGLDRSAAWVTNAVKRFRYRYRGKRRIHMPPNRAEVEHARWWVKQELRLIRPEAILAMGATAAQMLTGSREGLLARRGGWEDTPHGPVLVTLHPAYILRLPSDAERAEARAWLVADLRQMADRLAG